MTVNTVLFFKLVKAYQHTQDWVTWVSDVKLQIVLHTGFSPWLWLSLCCIYKSIKRLKYISHFVCLAPGVYCCGPASVNGILQGEALLKYDMPFVFAEVNADIVKWMVSDHTWSYDDENFGTCTGVKTPQIIKLFYSIFSMLLFFPRPCSHPQVTARGLKKKMHSDTKTVGQNISTKAVGSNMRNDITDSYKHREGKDCILRCIYLLCKK